MTDQAAPAGSSPDYLELAATIVSAYVTKNAVAVAELAPLIGSVHAALRRVGQPAPAQAVDRPVPAVPVRRSVTPDFLISLEDGKPYKALRRHLKARGLTPEEYRAKWGLPKDYPMVASSYAARRSEVARSIGLGQIRRKGATQSAASPEKAAAGSKKRSRKKPA